MIKLFSQISSKDILTCGGKGASLGEMTQAGFQVPGGFVLTTQAYGVNSQSREDQAYQVFDSLSCQFVAVRSSGTKEDGDEDSFAGQFDTYLFVTRDELINKIKECHASVNSDRMRSYCDSKGIDIKSIKVAVVIQKMINSDIAGVCFTINPITNNPDEVMIEGGYGVGEAVVSGLITPDNYIINKDTNHIEKSISTQTIKLILDTQNGGIKEDQVEGIIVSSQKLSDNHILELTHQAKLIEQHYGKPMDIERAVENGKLYILQARPVTTGLLRNLNFNKDDYLLAFQAQGVSVFVTDLHLKPYSELEVLFLIEDGLFKQFFTNRAFEKAQQKGLKFYQDEQGFFEYKTSLLHLYNEIDSLFNKEISGKSSIEKDVLCRFFYLSSKLCGDYRMMNFEFTDLAFKCQDQHPTIQINLKEVSSFKDEIRAIMNKVLFEQGGYCDNVFETLSIQFGLHRSVFDNSTQNEILNFYTNPIVNLQKLNQRNKWFAMHNDNQVIYEGRDAQIIISLFSDTLKEGISLLKGDVASRGYIKGNVKKIAVDYSNFEKVNHEIKAMKQGDILVAETTAPELMAACQKAGAIITDMGGMMSHAAIVSRELGIPCIVGTKHASRILKDGDLLEVDAINGIIKILTN